MTTRSIPTLPGLPFVGVLPQLTRDPLAFLTRAARDYGDVVRVPLGRRTKTYLVSDPRLIEEVHIHSNRRYLKGPPYNALRHLLGNGLVTSDGDFWLHQRRMIQPLFHRERIRAYGEDMVALTRTMLEGWRPGVTLDLNRELTALTFAIIAKTMFDTDVSTYALEMSRLLERGDRLVQRLETESQLPLPIGFLTRTEARLRHNAERLDALTNTLIVERLERGGDPRDLVGLLEAARGDDGQGMSRRQLLDEIFTLIAAGHETTATALTWTFKLLAEHPDVETQLYEEVKAVLDGRLPEAEDVVCLSFANAVVKEAMRLLPPVWSISRYALERMQLGDYELPAGSEVWLSQWVVHRDPRWYDAPLSFRPERWLDGSTDHNPKYAYFPFSGGPRLCIGSGFASLEAALLLVTIIQAYRVELAPSARVAFEPLTTLSPKYGLRVVLHTREA